MGFKGKCNYQAYKTQANQTPGDRPNGPRADLTIFTGWSAEERRHALPATADPVAAFVDAMAVRKAPATVRRYVSCVATFHRAARVANPCETLTVKLALQRMRRERGPAQGAGSRAIAFVGVCSRAIRISGGGARPRGRRPPHQAMSAILAREPRWLLPVRR
jgi:hypothetical protein